MAEAIIPGEQWLDTDGRPVQAHGGSVFAAQDGTFYFYGENKELTKPGSQIWHNGVNCYRSRDLITWSFAGNILKASDDEHSVLHPKRIMDRPHIVFNAKTGEYVMWLKLVGTEENPHAWSTQYVGIAVSDSIDGDYKLVDTFLPEEMGFGDFDIFIDDDGSAYLIFDKDHREIVVADLTDDYHNVTGTYSTHLHFDAPPLAREAPAVFKHEGTYYMITSGTTAYRSNRALLAKADRIHGPWYIVGDPCVDDFNHNTFDSQVSSVFRIPSSGQYIAVADRWIADPAQRSEKSSWNIDTSKAAYVWLPVDVSGGDPKLAWKDAWTPEV